MGVSRVHEAGPWKIGADGVWHGLQLRAYGLPLGLGCGVGSDVNLNASTDGIFGGFQ